MIFSKEESEHLLNELKRANHAIDNAIAMLSHMQSNKLSKATTDEDLSEYRTLKEAISQLKSVA